MVSASTISYWDSQFDASDFGGTLEAEERDVFATCATYFGDLSGKTVLDIGCGLGKNSIGLARLGAKVTAVDASNTAIAKLNGFATTHNLPIEAVRGDAMNIAGLGTFDYVVGSMILHHIEPFSVFCDALYAVMKPGGKAFFYENNSASQLLVWMRSHVVGKLWVPKFGDADEFPLSPQEVDILRRRLEVEQIFPEFLFFRLISRYLFRDRLGRLFTVADDFFYRHKLLERYSYRQILLIQKRLEPK